MSDLSLTLNDLPATSPGHQTRPLQAFSLAIVLEISIIALVALLLAHQSNQAPAPEAVALTLVDDPTPPEKIVEPKPLPVVTPSKVIPVKQVMPRQPSQPTPPLPTVAEMQTDSPNGMSNPAPPAQATPAPPPPPSHGKVDPNAEYAGKVHAAVQAAYFYPPAAAAMHFSGRVRVEFILRDGHVAEVRVLQGCGIGLFDNAAVQAVQNAHYPEPPAALRSQDLNYQLWIELSTR